MRGGRERRSRSNPRSRIRSTARSRPRRSASSPFPPTRPCWSCERCWRSAASPMTTGSERAEAPPDVVAWHDTECGAYGADLALWEDLALGTPGAVLELGAGTGRVALHLARAGAEVIAVERDPALAAEL